MVLAGPAMVAAKLSEASIQGKDQLRSLSASWDGQGQVVAEDGAGVIATYQAVVAAITAGLSTGPRNCVLLFPQS